MTHIIQVPIPRSSPHVAKQSFNIVAELLRLDQLSCQLPQVDGLLVAVGLRPGIAQIPTVVQLLHDLHASGGTDPQPPGDKFLCLDGVQWPWSNLAS